MKNTLCSLTLVLCGGVAMLASDPMPVRKAGLWETTMTGVGLGAAAAGTTKQCIDAATDRAAMSGAMTPSTCKQSPIVKTAAGYEFETICRISGMTSSSKSVVTGDFNSKIIVTVTSVVAGGGSLGQESKTTATSRYIGDCEAGQKPGDVIMPDGKVIRLPGAGPGGEAAADAAAASDAAASEAAVHRPSTRAPRLLLASTSAPVLAPAPASASASFGSSGREDVEGYADFRNRSSLTVDGQRVEMAPGGRVMGAPTLEDVPLGSEVKVRGQRRADGVILAAELTAKPNSYAMFESDILAATDQLEEQIRQIGGFVQRTRQGVKLVGRLETSGPRVERVNRIVGSLIPSYLPKGVIRAYVLDNKDWNAFAMANGAIFVFSGLLNDMDDDEVAIVLGHELAHSTYEHSRRGAKKAWVTELTAMVASMAASRIDSDATRAIVADVLALSAAAYENGYGRTMEDQADRVGLRYAYEGGWDVRKGPTLWTRFGQKYGDQDAVTNFFFGDHSQSSARARNLERELAINYQGAVPKPR